MPTDRFRCSRCNAAFPHAGDLFEHLVSIEEWDSESAYVRCQQLIYPEEWQADSEGVLRNVREFERLNGKAK